MVVLRWGLTPRVADILLQAFAIYLALLGPARRRQGDMAPPVSTPADAKQFASFTSIAKAKPPLRADAFVCGGGGVETPSENDFESESTTHSTG